MSITSRNHSTLAILAAVMQHKAPPPLAMVEHIISTTKHWTDVSVRNLRRYCVENGIGEGELRAIVNRVQERKGAR